MLSIGGLLSIIIFTIIIHYHQCIPRESPWLLAHFPCVLSYANLRSDIGSQWIPFFPCIGRLPKLHHGSFPCPFPGAFHHALPRVFAEYCLSISLVPRCFPAQMFVHLLGILRVIRRFSKIPSLFVILGVPLLVPCVVLGALPYGVRPPYLPGAFFCSWGC